MNYHDPGDQVFIPLIVSLRSDSADRLTQIANEMGVSLDELFSALAEDAAIGLNPSGGLSNLVIPDRVSKEALLRALQSK